MAKVEATERNVLGGELLACSYDPLTGYFRDGCCATHGMQGVAHLVCVRVTRPLKQRVEWLMKSLDTDDAESAESEIRRSDQAHAARMHEQFGVTWGDPLLYDLVLNTERLSVDSCVQQIRALVARPEFAETLL